MKVRFEGNVSFADERFNIIITDLVAFAICKVKLNVSYSWYEGALSSYAIYKANELGEVNLNTMIPIEGCYNVVDSMGLFYGLKFEKGNYSSRKERDFTREYITCKYIIESNHDENQTSIIRRFTTENILCLHEYNLFRGDFYYKKNRLNNKCIILLGGSEGRINAILPKAACLANRGFDVLALQYFNSDIDKDVDVNSKTLAKRLCEIPIEYAKTAVDWIIKQNPQYEVFIMGNSKGAELSLLAASYDKRITKIIAISPTAYVFEGINSFTSSWSINNKSIPYIHYLPFVNIIDLLKNMILNVFHLPQGFYFTYEISRLFSINKEKKRIKVENIDGNILLIAGKKDSMWNSTGAIKIIQENLVKSTSKTRSLHNKYVFYDGVGHDFYVPFIFPTDNIYGGNKYTNFMANEDSWKQIIGFLNQ